MVNEFVGYYQGVDIVWLRIVSLIGVMESVTKPLMLGKWLLNKQQY